MQRQKDVFSSNFRSAIKHISILSPDSSYQSWLAWHPWILILKNPLYNIYLFVYLFYVVSHLSQNEKLAQLLASLIFEKVHFNGHTALKWVPLDATSKI